MTDLNIYATEISFPDADPNKRGPCKDTSMGITSTDDIVQLSGLSEDLDQGGDVTDSVSKSASKHDNSTSGDAEKASTKFYPKHNHTEDGDSGADKVLKKPDKILPCPRCKSLNTKFCYYNNYNVNQPRHFCRKCQRYWTAGGMMRNVPVGAGRRKSKHSRIISIPANHLAEDEVVLKSGLENPLCKSAASILNLEGPIRNAETVSVSSAESGKEPSFPTSATPNSAENYLYELEAQKLPDGSPGSCSGFRHMHPLQGFPGPPWLYPSCLGWETASSTAVSHCFSENGVPSTVPWMPMPPVIFAAPAFNAPVFPFPVPASLWPCIPSWHNELCSSPWGGYTSGCLPSSFATARNMSSDQNSPTLGKHSRDGSLQGKENVEKSLWFPKTLRIHDPEEAAKSSIWSTLGISPAESAKRGSLFRGFQSSNEGSSSASDAGHILHANPAALARSQAFHEST